MSFCLFDTYSTVRHIPFFRILFVVDAINDLIIYQIDVKCLKWRIRGRDLFG